MHCPLCDARNQYYRVIFEDPLVAVVVNIEPLKPGHLMILPVRHVENLTDLRPDEAERFLQTIDRCMHAVTRMSTEGPMCLVNGWAHRTQPHLHAHVLPSKKSLRGLFAAAEGLHERIRADEATLTRMADEMRAVF